MYWHHGYPYSVMEKGQEQETKPKYSTTYLQSNIGKPVRVTLNYTSNSPINQNVEVEGILKEVGNDYFVITQEQENKISHQLTEGEDVFFYTVNLARIRFLNAPPAKGKAEMKSVKKRRPIT